MKTIKMTQRITGVFINTYFEFNTSLNENDISQRGLENIDGDYQVESYIKTLIIRILLYDNVDYFINSI